MSSEVTENYLKQIYQLALDESPVKTSQLAEALKLSAAAVSDMLKRLADQNLVSYRPYRGVSLTASGQQRALLILRRHRLWEVFLHRNLGLPWEQLHEHAERLEHSTNETLANHLAEYLGQPEIDPHGHPIPDEAGNVAEPQRLRLSNLTPGSKAIITQCVADENATLLNYLAELDLIPGTEVTIGQQAPFSGPLSLTANGKDCVIGLEAASTLIVEELN